MSKNTVNNPEVDNPIIEDVYEMLVEIGVYAKDEEPGFFDKALNKTLKGANDITYKIFGAKGFLDFFRK